MNIISMNVRGLGVTLKIRSLWVIVRTHSLDMILIQEIMMHICPNWFLCATSVNGLSGGLGILWNPRIFEMQKFISCAGIILTGHMVIIGQRIRIINSYAPYRGRR